MISLQSALAYNLDQQGVLPEKFADLALRPKTYEWYQKYVVQLSGSGAQLNLFRSADGILTEARNLLGTATEYTFETKVMNLTGSYYDTHVAVNHHASRITNIEGPIAYVSKTKIQMSKMGAGMGYQATTKTIPETNYLYVKIRTVSAERKSTVSYSVDKVNWTAIKTDSYGSSYWNYHSFWILAPSLECISLPDTKLIVDGVTYFDGKNSQRIS